MSHPEELLSAFLDGEINAAERIAVSEHLASCDACSVELTALEEARLAVRSLPFLELPLGVLPEADVVPIPTPLMSRAWVWVSSAAAALVIVGGIALTSGAEPASNIDLDALAERHTARVVVQPGIATIRSLTGGR